MTEKYNSIRWFLRELPRLREAGVVDDAALQKLREHYIDRLSSRKGPREYFVLVMGIVGAAMLAAGAILAINYNWDMFTHLNRCIIGAIPLAVGFIWGIIALCRNNNRGEREGAAIVSAGGIATLIAVVSQVYHIGGDFSDYMLLVLALSLPLVYIFNSIGLATIYVLGLFFIIGNSHSELWCSFGIVAFLPYLFYHLFSATPYRPWSRYLACLIAVFGMVSCGEVNPMFSCFSVATLGLLAGRELYEKRIKMRRNPWMLPSFFFMLVLLCAFSETGMDLYMAEKHKAPAVANYWIFNGITLVMILISYLRRRLDVERFMTGLWLLLLVPGFFPRCNIVLPYVEHLCIIYSVVFGALLLCRGFRRNHFTIFNGGMLLISSQFLVHFFSDEINPLCRAAGFAAVGAIFVAANIFFSRRLAKGEVK